MCMGGNKAVVTESPANALATSNQAMSNREQSYMDNVQKYYNPEVVAIDPNKLTADTVQYNKVRDIYDRAGQGDQNYKMRETTRGQIQQDLEGLDPVLQRQMMKAGVADSFMAGNTNSAGGIDRGNSIAANVLGRNYLAYRQGVQDQSMKFMGANPSDRALPSGMEMAGIDTINKQNYADARNNKMKTISDLAMWNMNNQNNRNQQELGALQQWGANNASNRNNVSGANQAAKGQMIGTGAAAIGTVALIAL
jgi:hypothetical protein